jgi:hypothetical protein
MERFVAGQPVSHDACGGPELATGFGHRNAAMLLQEFVNTLQTLSVT